MPHVLWPWQSVIYSHSQLPTLTYNMHCNAQLATQHALATPNAHFSAPNADFRALATPNAQRNMLWQRPTRISQLTWSNAQRNATCTGNANRALPISQLSTRNARALHWRMAANVQPVRIRNNIMNCCMSPSGPPRTHVHTSYGDTMITFGNKSISVRQRCITKKFRDKKNK